MQELLAKKFTSLIATQGKGVWENPPGHQHFDEISGLQNSHFTQHESQLLRMSPTSRRSKNLSRVTNAYSQAIETKENRSISQIQNVVKDYSESDSEEELA
jgi:hypothetical protein